ncbi:MAG: hypothetical protein ACKOWG_07950 [Planctomycetia bacterium]
MPDSRFRSTVAARRWTCRAALGCCLLGCGAPAEVRPAATPAPAPAAVEADSAPAATQAAAATPAVAAAVRDISFDDVKLDMQKGDPFSRDLVPPRVTALENGRVRIRGYILPSFQQTGLTQFVLVRDNLECCFGPGAALHDCTMSLCCLPGYM